MKNKISKKTSNKFLLTLSAAVILSLFLGTALQASRNNVNLQTRGASKAVIPSCPAVPKGTYTTKVKTYAGIPWSVSCPTKKGNFSGTIPAGEITIGSQSVPKITSGASYSFSTTLKKICDSSSSSPTVLSNWKQICLTCKYIDCSKVNLTGSGTASQIQCLLGGYTATGNGKISVSYSIGSLGSCSAKASYSGKVTGSFTPTKYILQN